MLIRNAQLLLVSTLLASTGQAYASPVLYAWAGNSVGATGGSTYVIDPVAGTVVQLRGAGDGTGSSSGANGGMAGSGDATGGNSGANSSGGSMGAVNSGGGVSPGALFAASSRARTFAGPPAVEERNPDACGPEQRLAAIERSAAEHANVDVLGMLSQCREAEADADRGASDVTLAAKPQTNGQRSADFSSELTPSEAPLFVSPSPNLNTAPLATIAAVPEPGSLVLLGSALAVFGSMVRRRKR